MKWTQEEKTGNHFATCGEMKYTIRKSPYGMWELYASLKESRFLTSSLSLNEVKEDARRHSLRAKPDNVFELWSSAHIHYIKVTTADGVILYHWSVKYLQSDIENGTNPEAFRQLLCVARDAAIDAGYLPQEG